MIQKVFRYFKDRENFLLVVEADAFYCISEVDLNKRQNIKQMN